MTYRMRLCWQISEPPHSLQRLLRRPCWHIEAPPQSCMVWKKAESANRIADYHAPNSMCPFGILHGATLTLHAPCSGYVCADGGKSMHRRILCTRFGGACVDRLTRHRTPCTDYCGGHAYKSMSRHTLCIQRVEARAGSHRNAVL